jgi:hypothetical protein
MCVKGITRESQLAKEAFLLYCKQEKRSLYEVAKAIGSPKITVERWSRAYKWQERTKQYDLDIAAAERKALRREAAKLAKRRIEQSTAMQQIGLRIISLAQVHAMDAEEARRHLRTAYKMVEKGMILERLETGESTVNVRALQPPKPLEDMTDAELEEYTQLLQDIA